MHIEPFKLEEWLKKREANTKYNLAENCVYAVTLDDFIQITKIDKKQFLSKLCQVKLDYGNIDGGTPILKQAISELYTEILPENILATHGATFANSHLIWSLIEPNDNVIAIYPDYQQFISLPKSFGAEVRILHRDPKKGYSICKEELDALCDNNTKLITLSNPNNPTGALLSLHELKELIEVARKYNTYIICDEVYRHVLQDDQVCPSIADLYEKGISVGSMSKACSMAGIRLGWIATKDKHAMQNIKYHIGYDMSSVGGIKEYIAAIALKYKKALIDRNMSLLRVNLITLDGWLRQNKNHLSYVYPKAGSTVLVFYDYDVPSEKLCSYLYNTTGTLITPGDIFNVPHSFRISYACDHRQLLSGLVCLSEVCEKLNNNPHFFDDINP